MKISVIIPAYNVEHYIAETLDSVLRSEYQDFEIILVNDGSTDGTGEICRQYSEKYKNIIYIAQKNQGVSAARNHAMSCAKGDWIVFVDADDNISVDFFSAVSGYGKEYDILFFGDDSQEDEKEEPIEKVIKENDSRLKEKLIYNLIAGKPVLENLKYIHPASPWAKAYRREFLVENKIHFPAHIKIGEDLLFNLQCYIHMKTGKFCKEQVYLVTVRPESASYRYHEDFIEIDRKFQLCLIEQLKKSGVYHTYKRAVYISAVNGFWMIVMKRIYSPLNKESGRQKYMLLKTVRKDKIYKTAFEKITCKEIYEDSRFPIKQKGVLFLIKIRGIAAAHGFILLWTRTRDGKR